MVVVEHAKASPVGRFVMVVWGAADDRHHCPKMRIASPVIVVSVSWNYLVAGQAVALAGGRFLVTGDPDAEGMRSTTVDCTR